MFGTCFTADFRRIVLLICENLRNRRIDLFSLSSRLRAFAVNPFPSVSSANDDFRRDAAVDVQVGVEAVHRTAHAGPAVKGLVFLHERDPLTFL